MALTVLGVISSWAAAVNIVETAGTTVDRLGHFRFIEIKTPIFYAIHGVALTSVMAAGLLSALSGRLRIVSIGTRVAFLVLCLSAAIWGVVAYRTDELFSSQVFDATGPFVWFSVLFLLTATDRAIWTYLDPVIRLLAYASTVLGLRTLLSGQYGYYLGFSKYIQYTMLLTWLGGWTFLTATRMRGWRLFARSIPIMVLFLMALFSQSRSWLLLWGILILTFVILRARERGSRVQGIQSLALVCIFFVVAGALVYTAMPGKLAAAAEGLSGRLLDDTRSGQYQDFFSDVPITDLILGRGPKGTWYWPTVGDYRFFDNGYLWMLFEGGVPIFLAYVVIVVGPALRALRRGPTGGDAAAVCLVLVWGLALTGLSTFVVPSISIIDALVLLFAGRCHLFLAENRGWERSERRRLVSVPPPALSKVRTA